MSVIGRDRFGVFPLRGKVLNVRDASHKQIVENQVFQTAFQLLSLSIPVIAIMIVVFAYVVYRS